MASSSSEEEMARFLPLDAGGGVALAFAGDFADAAPEIEEGRGRAVVWGWVLPEIGVIYKMIAHTKPGPS